MSATTRQRIGSGRRPRAAAACLATLVAGAAVAAGPARAAVPPVPPVLTGLQLWYEADGSLGQDGQAVTSWMDKSGNARHLTSAGPGSAPALRLGAVNGHAALEFDGAQSLMKTYASSFVLPQPTTFFIVYRSLDPDTGSRAFVLDSRNSSVRQVVGRAGAGSMRMYANIDLDFAGFTYPFPDYQIWSGTFDGGASSLYRNGALIGTGNTGGSGLDGFTVGALSTSGPYGYDYAHVLVAEILYYTGALSASDRQAVTDWLGQKYALAGPATPPAGTAPPAVTGVASQGRTLTASTGTWTGTQPISYAYAWQRCDASGTACLPIPGASAPSYTVTSTDVGFTLRAAVTATNSAGSATATSAPTPVVTPPSGGGSPPVTAGLALWYDATAESYADGAAVMRLTDRSGFGRDLTAYDASAAPLYRAAAVNGRAAVELDGVRSLLKTYGSTFTLSQPTTFFVVFRSLDPASGSSEFLFDSRNSSVRQLLGRGGSAGLEMYADNPLSAGAAFPFSTFQVWAGAFDGAASSLWQGTARVASGNAGTSALEGLAVGGLSTSAQWGYAYSHSLVAEVLYYAGHLSDADIATTVGWLKQRYGL